MNFFKIYDKALQQIPLDRKESLLLYLSAPLNELIYIANEIRKIKHPGNKVSWIIDRNVNITNVCISQCSFCNFCRKKNDVDAYITSMEQYKEKIEELYKAGGRQLLLQGGMHPDLGLNFYKELFTNLKKAYPDLKLHALGPPEIVYLAKKERKTFMQILEELMTAGLDSLPGAGAEILSDRVRKILSPAKCTTREWLEVMRCAHKLNLPTSATMMFGHIETPEERIEHILSIRNLQQEKPEGSYGFLSFIPWTFQHNNTVLFRKKKISSQITMSDYIRIIAVSRIILHNVNNIQPSWLTVGVPTAQFCLHAGANDFGSVMMEENVLSETGIRIKMHKEEMINVIKEAGFIPVLRNQKFEYI